MNMKCFLVRASSECDVSLRQAAAAGPGSSLPS